MVRPPELPLVGVVHVDEPATAEKPAATAKPSAAARRGREPGLARRACEAASQVLLRTPAEVVARELLGATIVSLLGAGA
jgi:hypothetical protein